MSRARKFRKHRRASGTPRPHPGFVGDLAHELLPAVAGFVGSRLSTRVLTLMLSPLRPKLARHAGALSSIGVFAAAYFGAHKIKALAKYQDGIVLGAGIGAAATIVQTYDP